MIAITKDNSMLGYSSLQLYPNIFHFVTTRQAGYSKGAYDSFNCSPFCGDEAEHVALNQQKLISHFPSQEVELIIPHQTHGCEVGVIDADFLELSTDERKARLEGVDALITNQTNCCLAISTADCVPVLLYDKMNHAVAAIHAGWRGTVQNIVGKTIDKMTELYGTRGVDLIASIGPSISQDAFEVGDEVFATFQKKGFEMLSIANRHQKTQKWHIDLWEANRQLLLAKQIPSAQIEVAGICTWTQHEQFFSARRLGIASGRILSGIMIK